VWFQDGPVEGQALYDAGAELGDRRGASASADWARMESMWTRYDLGAWDDLLEISSSLLDRERERGRNIGSSQLSVLAEIYRRDVLVHRGLPDPDNLVERSLLERARAIGDGQVVVPGFRVAALGRLSRGDIDGALALVSESEALLRERPWSLSWSLDWSSRVCRAAGAADLLRSLVDRGIDHLTRNANSMATARATLAEIVGDDEIAIERYDDAAARWASFPSILEHGHALSGAGRCLLALGGRPFDAVERLTRARSAYALLEAAPLVAEVDALLAEATAKTS
jgi:hypothetical protein